MNMSNNVVLNTLNVPIINDFEHLAEQLSLTQELLYFLTYKKQYCYTRKEIPKKDGLTTEIDLIMLHKHGIVVIENKDYTGTFYGKASDDMWTGIGYTGISYSFYNPIKQNEGHIHALKEYLVANEVYGVEEDIPIYSVIVFTDLVSNRSDDIISRIDLSGTQSHVCTSQNLARTVWNLLENTVPNKVVDVQKVESFLLPLPIRRK